MKLANLTLLITLPLASFCGVAADSVHHSGQASKHTALASAHTTVSTAKVASAVVATPLIIAGASTVAVGSAALHSGEKLADSGAKIKIDRNQPLVITETTITVDPKPDTAIVIQTKQKAQ
jgi:hypothetical protein